MREISSTKQNSCRKKGQKGESSPKVYWHTGKGSIDRLSGRTQIKLKDGAEGGRGIDEGEVLRDGRFCTVDTWRQSQF